MDRLEDYLVYDVSSPTGLRWAARPSRNVQVGDVAMRSMRDGYYSGEFRGKKLRAHRVVYYLVHGVWPTQIDHIDGVRTNNNVLNLRPVSLNENQHNRKARGTQYCRGKWQAKITVGGKVIALGTYPTEADAHAAYLAAKKQHHPTAPERCYDTTRGVAPPREASCGWGKA